MKKVMFAMMAVITFSGCTTKVIDFVEKNGGEHPNSGIIPQSEGTLVYKASDWSKQCLKDKREARGWWIMQDEVDCWDNAVK